MSAHKTEAPLSYSNNVIGDRTPEIPDILELTRPGRVLTFCWHSRAQNVIYASRVTAEQSVAVSLAPYPL